MKYYLLVLTIFSINIFGDKDTYTYDLRLAPELFDNFQKYYKKNYTREETWLRYKIFKNNLKRVNALNQNIIVNWVAVIGPYNDLTYAEFVKKYDLPAYTKIDERKIVNCHTDRKLYLFKRFSEYTKKVYEKWGSWKAPPEYDQYMENEEDYEDELLNDYH